MSEEHIEECPSIIEVVNEDSADIASKKYPGNKEFVHLHSHSLFSPLDGVASVEDYFSRAKYLGMNAIAITDHGTLGAMPDAYFASKDTGIKFIPGCEIYLNEHHTKLIEYKANGISLPTIRQTDPLLADRMARNRHLVVLAKDNIGFKNLLHLTTEAWEKDSFYYKPRIWMDKIKQHKEGLIVLSACLNGPISFELVKAVEAKRENKILLANEYLQNATNWVKTFKNEFGDDFYFEIQMPGPELKAGYDILKLSINLAKKFNIKTVLTGDSHYLHKEDSLVQRALMAIDQDTTVDDPNMFSIDTSEGYLKSRAEFRQTFFEQGYEKYASIADIEIACDNTLEVAAKCQSFKPDLSPKLPIIDNADNQLSDLVFKRLKEQNLLDSTHKYLCDNKMVTHLEQTNIELKRIKEKGFSSYFLITYDMIRKNKELGYIIGPARGSSGGSLVCYFLEIVEMDPLLWGLSFNRFLSPSRGGNMLTVKMD